MTTWTSEELATADTTDQMQISSVRGDATLSSQRTIWMVREGQDLYVRSVNGPDAAYRSKYRRYAKSIVDSINSPKARSTTLKLLPR